MQKGGESPREQFFRCFKLHPSFKSWVLEGTDYVNKSRHGRPRIWFLDDMVCVQKFDGNAGWDFCFGNPNYLICEMHNITPSGLVRKSQTEYTMEEMIYAFKVLI